MLPPVSQPWSHAGPTDGGGADLGVMLGAGCMLPAKKGGEGREGIPSVYEYYKPIFVSSICKRRLCFIVSLVKVHNSNS